jgi:predicted TIM-barrel fold metal-dependent hydrolase
MAHMSLCFTHDEQLMDTIKDDFLQIMQDGINQGANLYADISWVGEKHIVSAITKVGADRILFGTDAPISEFASADNYGQRVLNISRSIKLRFPHNCHEIASKIFYDNAKKLFFIGAKATSDGPLI